MKRRFSAEEKQRYLTEYAASDEALAAFAKRTGLSPKTLYSWVSPLSKKKSTKGRKPKFAQLWPSETPIRAAKSTLRIAVGGGLIEVDEGFNPTLLRAVVAALSSENES